MAKLSKDEIVTLHTLGQIGQSNRAIARQLNVTEGTVRYHRRRQANSATDGRKKRSLIETHSLVETVCHWWQQQLGQLPVGRSPNVQQLWQFLVHDHQYTGSYKSVAKYVRGKFDKPKLRPFRRVETPPAAQTQSDWLEQKVSIDNVLTTVYGFVMTLSHSRMTAVIWSSSMNQLAWHHVHNEAFKRLGGVAAVNRIDNLKTGVAHGSGPWGKINESYSAYARTMGFHVDPHEVRQPQQKGKVERRVSATRGKLDLQQNFESLEALQAHTDERLDRDARNRQCPVTGKSVFETWQDEVKLLRPLPATLPQPFDLIRMCPVHKDCTIRFEGRTYTVPFAYAYRSVEVRGCNGFIQVVDRSDGQMVRQYPRQTKERLIVDPTCYDGKSTDLIAAPKPLGTMARKLEAIAATTVQQRSIDIYAADCGGGTMKIAQTRKLHAAGILPKPAPTQDAEALRERLEALRLMFAAESLDDLLNDSVKQDWNATKFLDALLRLELERQEERRVAQAIRISHLPTGPTIGNFDFAFQPSVSRRQLQTLASGQWIRDGQGLLLQGPPGVGKTHLAIGLGMRAIETGFSVSFYRLDELMHQLKRDAELSPARLKHRKYMAANLVIIDEFGYQQLDREESNLFFRVVN